MCTMPDDFYDKFVDEASSFENELGGQFNIGGSVDVIEEVGPNTSRAVGGESPDFSGC